MYDKDEKDLEFWWDDGDDEGTRTRSTTRRQPRLEKFGAARSPIMVPSCCGTCCVLVCFNELSNDIHETTQNHENSPRVQQLLFNS